MSVKPLIKCPYCAAQGISMDAKKQKADAVLPWNTRYGCGNEHYFAVPAKSVLLKDAA